jgi:hypothetical protein
MQTAVPEVMQTGGETRDTNRMYGIDANETKSFGRMCLVARRLVERGLRFVQLYHDGWDAHSKLKSNHSTRIKQVESRQRRFDLCGHTTTFAAWIDRKTVGFELRLRAAANRLLGQGPLGDGIVINKNAVEATGPF